MGNCARSTPDVCACRGALVCSTYLPTCLPACLPARLLAHSPKRAASNTSARAYVFALSQASICTRWATHAVARPQRSVSGRCSSRCQIHRADSPQVQSELRPLLRPPSVPVSLAPAALLRLFPRAAASLNSSSASPSPSLPSSSSSPSLPSSFARLIARGYIARGLSPSREERENSYLRCIVDKLITD